MNKPKIALYWCSSCGGCEASVIDLGLDLLKLSQSMEIIFWPVAMDARYQDIEALDDGSILASFINGAIQQEDHVDMARMLRRKSRFIFANGSCAHTGGIVGLANLHQPAHILQRAYIDTDTTVNPEGTIPGCLAHRDCKLPRLLDRVMTLDQVVGVDYYVPGCPPPSELIKNALYSLLDKSLPPKGSILSENRALCHSCPRQTTFPAHPSIRKFKRIHETLWNSQQCFLDQGIICLGPSTRGGCHYRCISANMPCRGCFGPLDNVRDQGAKSIAYVSSLIDETEPDKIAEMVSEIADPTGLFYRYCLAASMITGIGCKPGHPSCIPKEAT